MTDTVERTGEIARSRVSGGAVNRVMSLVDVAEGVLGVASKLATVCLNAEILDAVPQSQGTADGRERDLRLSIQLTKSLKRDSSLRLRQRGESREILRRRIPEIRRYLRCCGPFRRSTAKSRTRRGKRNRESQVGIEFCSTNQPVTPQICGVGQTPSLCDGESCCAFFASYARSSADLYLSSSYPYANRSPRFVISFCWNSKNPIN